MHICVYIYIYIYVYVYVYVYNIYIYIYIYIDKHRLSLVFPRTGTHSYIITTRILHGHEDMHPPTQHLPTHPHNHAELRGRAVYPGHLQRHGESRHDAVRGLQGLRRFLHNRPVRRQGHSGHPKVCRVHVSPRPVYVQVVRRGGNRSGLPELYHGVPARFLSHGG
jgi:hypothetical protein